MLWPLTNQLDCDLDLHRMRGDLVPPHCVRKQEQEQAQGILNTLAGMHLGALRHVRANHRNVSIVDKG